MTQKNADKTGLISALLAASVAILLSAGCACPHRKAISLHTVEVFNADLRCDGLVARETWRDQEGGGGWFLFADPNVQGMAALHTNQAALGGGSAFTAGSLTLVVDTNTAAILNAGGSAIGNIIGAAVKTAVK